MSLRIILLSIQYISIAALFIESILVFRRWKNRIHGYLFISCIAALVNNVGYLFELTARSEEAYITALRISYSGRVWFGLFMFLFLSELCKVRLSDTVRSGLLVVHLITYIAVFTFQHHTLYYSSTNYVNSGIFPRLLHEKGILYYLFINLQTMYIIVGLAWLVILYGRERNETARHRIKMVILAIVAESFFLVIQLTGVHQLTRVYDVTMIGYTIGTVFMLIAIQHYDLLGTGELAKEFMIDRLSEGIIAVDRDGEVAYYNDLASELYPELKSEPLAVVDEIRQIIKDEGNISINDRIYTPEENDLIYKEENLGRLYALVDDTDHYRYMEDLKKQKEIADSANAAKSRFLANMSHEIRTPINSVLGMDEMILRESKEKTIRAYAADIMSAGRTLLTLINDILDFSKVEEGKMEIIPVQYDLSSLINDLVNMIRDSAAKKGLKLVVDVNENIPHYLIGDEIRIKQCVLNVLTNAVKYTEKGTVCLKVSYEKKDELNILLDLSVKDTGIGMKEQDMEKLFSPYKRIDEKYNRTVEGTGLGMTITRQLLELMGSELSVKSEYGKGTEVSFSIKQQVVSWEGIGDFSSRYNGKNNDLSDYHELFHAPQARILVVDDTEMNLTVIQSLLKMTKIRIDTALSGEDAITLAATNRYDVILIDHMMPKMDGIETLKHLREEGKNQDTPAVALTANAVSGARERYLNAGFIDYMSKPVDGSKLEHMLKNLLPQEKIQEAPVTVAPGRTEGSKDRSSILVVDDDESVCTLVKSIMEPGYDIITALTGRDAVREAREHIPDLIMLDIHLSDDTGFNIMQKLKGDVSTAKIPVLLITGDYDSVTEENGFKSGASDYIRKPFAPDVLKQRAKRIIDLNHYQKSIEKEVRRQTSRSKRLTREMMLALSKTVDTKDHYTDGHSRRVAAMCAEIGRRLGKNDLEQVTLYEIGLLHDIGKIGIHDDIIHKETKLSDNEFAMIKAHTIKGDEILREITDMPTLHEGARWHHEHFDGKGYPDGLMGEEIPENARIACIADCYDAMTSTRTYSVPRKQEDVRAEILRCSGTWFDPQIAEVMLAMIDEDKDYRMNEHAEGADVWKEYDRLWVNAVSSEEDGGSMFIRADETNILPQWLKKIPEISTDTGLKNCGSVDGYMAVLSTFHQTAGSKADEIEELYRADDIENYTIKVHALKSSARIIGALGLSKMALSLEEAGKAGDRGTIQADTDKLLKEYRALDEKLKEIDGNDAELEQLSEEMRKEAFQTIGEIAESMDFGMMDDMIRRLKGYRLSEEDEKRIRKIEELLMQLDWEGISSIIKEV